MLICLQKVNFVNHIFLKIFQRNSNFFIFGNLGISHTHQKLKYHFEEAFDNYQQGKINSILYVFLEIFKRYYKFDVLGTLGVPVPCTPKVILSICRNSLCFSAGKKPISKPMLFLRCCKDMQTYFEYFGHVWLSITKMIVSTYRILWYLSVCEK